MAIPDGLSFDELNKLYDKEHDPRSMPFEKYFGEMDLSSEQKHKRIDTAQKIDKFMLMAIMSMYYAWHGGAYEMADVSGDIASEYQSLLDNLGIPLTVYFLATRPGSAAAEIVASTMDNVDDPYFFSEDRARFIAENEANSIWNDSDFQDAILTGKTSKRWSAIMDKRTRHSHREVNGAIIPIYEYFQVGNSLMLYPRDTSAGAGAEEIVNCRCSVIYL